MSILDSLANYGSSSEEEEEKNETTELFKKAATTKEVEVKTEVQVEKGPNNDAVLKQDDFVAAKSTLAAYMEGPDLGEESSDDSSEVSSTDEMTHGSHTKNADSTDQANASVKKEKDFNSLPTFELPPPDFDTNDLGAGGINHPYRDHCGCKSCENTRWRRVHRDKSLEVNVAKRKEREMEEVERKKRARIRENLRKRGIRRDPTALSKIQKVTGVVKAAQSGATIVESTRETEIRTGVFQAENAYARAVRQKQAREASRRARQ